MIYEVWVYISALEHVCQHNQPAGTKCDLDFFPVRQMWIKRTHCTMYLNYYISQYIGQRGGVGLLCNNNIVNHKEYNTYMIFKDKGESHIKMHFNHYVQEYWL